MGKKKIEIKRLEPASHRNNTFGKRFKGLTKKVEEFSVLCDVPVLLVATKPTGEQKLCLTGNRSFEQIVQQFVNEPKESRDKDVRQAEGDKTFERKKQLEKIDADIAQLEDLLGPLRCTDQIEKISSFDQLAATEIYLQKLVSLHEGKKALLLEQQKIDHPHLPTPYESNPKCSTSTAPLSVVPTALFPSDATTPLINGELAQAVNLEALPSSSQQSNEIGDLVWLCDSIEGIDPDWLTKMDKH